MTWLAPPLTTDEWHAWYATQAAWTVRTREWLYREAGLAQSRVVLDVGCGTGIIAGELAGLGTARVLGVDRDPAVLSFARRRGGDVVYAQGDAHALPFSACSFDLVVCHYLLLWLADPVRGVREMARLVRPGGCVLACAEPDYGGRIDYPPELASLGRLQAESLRRQGAEPGMGRRLGEIFAAAGLQTTVGVMSGYWNLPGRPGAEFEAEWAMRKRDLAGLLAPEEIERLRAVDEQALLDGRRVLFVPTFYALGRKIAPEHRRRSVMEAGS